MSTISNVTPSVLWFNEDDKLKYIAFAATMEENHTGTATVSKYPVQSGFEVSSHLIRHNRQINIRAFIPENSLGGLELEGADAGFLVGNMANKYLGVDMVGLSTIVGGIVTDPTGVANNYLEGAVSSISTTVRSISDPLRVAASTLDRWTGKYNIGLEEKVGSLVGAVDKYTLSASRRINAFDTIQRIQEEGIMCALGTALHSYDNLVLVDYKIPTSIDAMTVMFVDLTFEQVRVESTTGGRETYISVGDVNDADAENVATSMSKVSSLKLDIGEAAYNAMTSVEKVWRSTP